MPDDSKSSLVETLGQHKGKLAVAGSTGAVVVTLIVNACLDHLEEMIHHNKEIADGNVPAWIYNANREKTDSNILALQLEVKAIRNQR